MIFSFHVSGAGRCLLALLLLCFAPPGCRAQTARDPQQKGAATTTTPPAPSTPALDAGQMLADVKALSSDAMEGRRTGTPGGERAREYVVEAFKRAGLKPFGESFVQPFTFKGKDGKEYRAANVVGQVEGRADPRRFIVVTAHYDHEGIKGGQIYNGADDNASGVGVLLALAEHFTKHPPAHSIIFAALDGEELGLKGAKAFVEHPPAELSRIALDVNMDMVSRSDRGELYVAGTYHNPSLKPVVEKVAGRARVKLLPGHDRPEQGHDDWTMQSDQGVFHQAGIPFLYLGVEDHKDYHQPTDDFENINPDFYVRAAETILDLLRELDQNLPQKQG